MADSIRITQNSFRSLVETLSLILRCIGRKPKPLVRKPTRITHMLRRWLRLDGPGYDKLMDAALN